MEKISIVEFIDFLNNDIKTVKDKIILVPNSYTKIHLLLKSNKNIVNCIFEGTELFFYNTHEQNFYYKNNSNFGITFKNLIFKNINTNSIKLINISIIENHFNNSLLIEKSIINELTLRINIKQIDIIDSNFNNKIYLFLCIIEESLLISKSIFKELLFAQNDINILKIGDFKEGFSQENIKNYDVSNVIEKLIIKNSKIKDLQILNISNKINLLHIYSFQFYIENLQLNSLDFENLILSDFKNSKKIDVTNCNNFNGITINKINVSNLRLDNNNFFKIIKLNSIECNSLSIQKNFIDKINIIDLKIKNLEKLNLNTILILKKYFRDNGYLDEELKFNELEKNDLFKIKNIDWKDKIILFVKKISNHGTDWFKAVRVTLGISIIFYIIIFFILNDNSKYCDIYSSFFWNGFLKYLNITDYSNPLSEQKLPIKNFWANLIFYLGKIFLGIGIYETIISFRKYHK